MSNGSEYFNLRTAFMEILIFTRKQERVLRPQRDVQDLEKEILSLATTVLPTYLKMACGKPVCCPRNAAPYRHPSIR
jgi:hypothetical protein